MVIRGTLICCTRWTVDKSDVAPKIRARRAFCPLASAKIVETWDSRFRHSYSSHPRSQKTKSFHEIDMQFPWSVLLLGTLKDVQRKRSLWMNMLELRFQIFRVFQIFRSSSEKFNIWRSTSVPEELQAFATDTGLADGVLLPHRPLELVWQAAKVKQFLGVCLT